MSSLSPTARVVLGIVALTPSTGYDIKQLTDRSTRFFWGASYGQIYPELKRLEERGLVSSSDEPRGRVRRRVYRITPKGRRALRAWLLDGETSFEFRDEGLLRLFFRELLAPAELLELVRRRREWSELSAREFEAIGEELGVPNDDVLRYGIELMEWNAAWFARLEKRLTH
jgi:PadR family transcriptional regulator, regulatory protein AphA